MRDVIGWLLQGDPAIRWQVLRDLTDASAGDIATERSRVATTGWGRLVGDQLDDGGWNCEAERGSTRSSFHSTICVLEGLLEYEQATGGTPASRAARRAGGEYLLDRKLLRRQSTGDLISEDWLRFSYPTRWYYDVLRGLDYFRADGIGPDPRLGEAVEVVRSKQQPDGAWLLENTHAGKVHFPLEDGDGKPSRWNTLRALRVLRWYGRR
ncbi:hypothetical protein [Arthrobacter sp. AD-310]